MTEREKDRRQSRHPEVESEPGGRKGGVMKNQPEERIFTKKGLLLGALLFSIYAVLLLWATLVNPEWIMWAGQMTLGALYGPDPSPLFDNPQEAFQIASVFSLLGLLTLLLLMVVMGEVRFGWLSWLKAQLRERLSQEAREAKEQPEVGAGVSSLDVDLGREGW
ncbi:MAG: hypothetical protein ACK4Z6_05150 [Candidatus Methylomirabilales bacterium]